MYITFTLEHNECKCNILRIFINIFYYVMNINIDEYL
jgi:hypothetical protein